MYVDTHAGDEPVAHRFAISVNNKYSELLFTAGKDLAKDPDVQEKLGGSLAAVTTFSDAEKRRFAMHFVELGVEYSKNLADDQFWQDSPELRAAATLTSGMDWNNKGYAGGAVFRQILTDHPEVRKKLIATKWDHMEMGGFANGLVHGLIEMELEKNRTGKTRRLSRSSSLQEIAGNGPTSEGPPAARSWRSANPPEDRGR